MTTKPLYQHIAIRVQARANCIASGNTEWQRKHESAIAALVKQFMPSGAGIDTGTHFWFEDRGVKQSPDKLTFDLSFHHMAESGMYAGWNDYVVVVRPSLAFGIELTIKGVNRNDIKDYLAEVYQHALTQPVDDSFLASAAA